MNIEHVSDTARWVAVYRVMESERADAHFRDPFARRLAGEQGEAIVRGMSRGRQMAWPMIVRTAVFDEIILDCVRSRGADLVLNLAAGLDARPWRLDLPGSLRWVDVDLPGMVEYKAEVMAGERPRCRYEAISADLADPAQRDDALGRAAAGSERALVVTEGLLVYLEPDDVGALAAALAARPAFRWWLTDLASPRLMKMMQKWWSKGMDKGSARFRFAPAESSAFFAPYGWREAAWRPTIEDADRLRRTPRGMWLWKLLGKLQPKRKQEEMRRFAGNLLLERANAAQA
ncbi:MAG: class I SAM-dependent methyltransferase [Longimicrobiaceae bacterium]